MKIGDHRCQSLVELYSILIAVRAWAPRWAEIPSMLLVRSDSMAAIGGLQRGGTTRSTHVNRVLQEMAITLACSPTGLRLRFKHLPGDRNQWADALSRLSQPGSGARVPAPLQACERTEVEERGAQFWITGAVPEVALMNQEPEGVDAARA